jgi:hypothetical protein
MARWSASAVGLLFFGIWAAGASGACPNEAARTGPSAQLANCRAYELISPADAGGLRPVASNFSSLPNAFESELISPSADRVVFNTIGGALPGTLGTGGTDRYEAVRGLSGWTTQLVSPGSEQAEEESPGGFEPSHAYQFIEVKGKGGSLVDAFGAGAALLRLPDGSFDLLGRGSVGEDPEAVGDYISPGGGHIVFHSGTRVRNSEDAVRLEPQAPPSGTAAVYDRTPDGTTHVVSLLPEDKTPAEGESAYFDGVSADGSMVLFSLGTTSQREPILTLYARVDNAITKVVASGTEPITPAGVSANGDTAFFLEGGDAFAFDVASGATTPITSSSDIALVNISADGSHVYFISPSLLDGTNGTEGANNLYVWDEVGGATRFIATVAPEDVTGPQNLIRWTTDAVFVPEAGTEGKDAFTGAANATSRTTPDGSVIVFESRAKLTGYENAGFVEVYRYDADAGTMACVSCDPQGDPPGGNAALQSLVPNGGTGESIRPLVAVYPVANVSDDGGSVFFQAADSLVTTDIDGRQDVYEWNDGVVSLVSSGASVTNDYLYAATRNGSDVLFVTGDRLVGEDQNGGAGALYDARVGGGFPAPPPPPPPCEGDACQGEPTGAPALPPLASSLFSGKGNLKPRPRRCRRQRGQRRGGERPRRCVRGKAGKRGGRGR